MCVYVWLCVRLPVFKALGEKVTGDRASYQYLVESIRNFPPQEGFAAMIRAAGFAETRHDNLTGGVVCVHTGFKLPMVERLTIT
jgi:ubiquinone/menaquinone biosynthesis C-methylase UbiE